MLTLHIGLSHEDLTLHVHERTNRSRSHAVLSSPCLGNNALLAHLLCHQDLSHRVVYLVCSRVVQVFAFKIELATIFLAHALSMIERRGSSHIIFQQGVIFVLKLFALYYRQISLLQVGHTFI